MATVRFMVLMYHKLCQQRSPATGFDDSLLVLFGGTIKLLEVLGRGFVETLLATLAAQLDFLSFVNEYESLHAGIRAELLARDDARVERIGFGLLSFLLFGKTGEISGYEERNPECQAGELGDVFHVFDAFVNLIFNPIKRFLERLLIVLPRHR